MASGRSYTILTKSESQNDKQETVKSFGESISGHNPPLQPDSGADCFRGRAGTVCTRIRLVRDRRRQAERDPLAGVPHRPGVGARRPGPQSEGTDLGHGPTGRTRYPPLSNPSVVRRL